MEDARSTVIGGRYDLELAVMEELPSYRLEDVQNAPADFVEEVLLRRKSRQHWQNERRRFDASMKKQRANAQR